MTQDLRATLRDALATVTHATGHDADALFGDHLVEPDQMPAPAAHAMGVIEGAATALGLTALELLDEYALT